MKILFLYAELMGYVLSTVNELSHCGSEIHVVHWDVKKQTPFLHQPIDHVTFYARSLHPTGKIIELASQVNPDMVFISGWTDRGYLKVAKELRKKGISVVAGFDSQWKGTLKQRLASCLGFYWKRCFSHAWVAGPYQFEFARRLGFHKNKIIFDLYSADLPLYNEVYDQCKETKKNKYPHRFLFVGRFEKIKAIDLLVAAWDKLEGQRKDWELHFIGNGLLKSYLQKQNGITVRDFLQPHELKKEIFNAGCLILPSYAEPWGVVVHEFAAAGLPIICSEACGAAPIFVMNDFNGFRFETGNGNALAGRMLSVINSDDHKLCAMSEASHLLGQRITPASSTANLLSIIKTQP